MARPVRNTADYFSHDADASDDDKLLYLECRFGLAGYALYFKVLEKLTRSEGFEVAWNDAKEAVWARQFGVELSLLHEFIVAATTPDVAALSLENGVLFSPGLKKRLLPLVEKRQKDATRIAENRAKKDKTLISGVVAATTRQSKVKYTKGRSINTSSEEDIKSGSGPTPPLENTIVVEEEKKENTPQVPAAPPLKQPDPAVLQVVTYLNDLCGTEYKATAKATATLINARISEGWKTDDLLLVVAHKAREWLHDVRMRQYLRPETLFRAAHFESYVNAANLAKQNPQPVNGKAHENGKFTFSLDGALGRAAELIEERRRAAATH